MAASTHDRTVTGRFVRNLALSLTGGAVLTLVGAAAAHAQEAGTASDGSAGTGTGDATAVGNRSGTSTNQGVAPGSGGTTTATQTAIVPNVGVAVANTGGNIAVGNASNNTANATQNATGGTLATSNSGEASNASDGSAWITTGDASAVGNESTTTINQQSHGAVGGLLVTNQIAIVPNVGVGIANTGVNAAVGNVSQNQVGLLQNASTPNGLASNSGAARNASDGSATIITGAASATGNKSTTEVAQGGGASGDDGIGGLVVITQAGVVANLGLGVANTGGNLAVGNGSQNGDDDNYVQEAAINDATVETPLAIASNQAEVGNSSDGDASIRTGDAWAIGNDANTNLSQTTHADTNSLGGIVSTQVAGVLNAGVGVANTGVNLAVGNASTNVEGDNSDLGQNANVGPGIDADIDAPIVTASNSATVSSVSDGSAEIRTGAARATGNRSYTDLTQDATGDVDGLGNVINTQVGFVANVGLGVANSGVNVAVGNVSDNLLEGAAPVSGQTARIDGDINAIAPLTASNSLSATNRSDGSASVHTGDATATGNDSQTWLSQDADLTITPGSMGVVPNVQLGVVANVGIGVANSGINAAIGNASGRIGDPNTVASGQSVSIDPDSGDTLDVLGPVTASNSATLENASDGTAKVGTGKATATGNTSETVLSQDIDASVDGMGVPVAPQVGVVLNLGAAVANSGINAAVGNLSTNTATAVQIVLFEPSIDTTVVGPLTGANTSETGNSSDGEACVCTGDATASGNISRSVLAQDIDITVDDGVSVVPTVGVIFNAGFGLANSGVNLAVGNVSTNTATATQTSELDPAADPLLVGPQTFVNGGGATNVSDGLAEVGTGKATATGNESTSELQQAAVVNGSGTVALLTSAIANVGLGLANSGINLGIGNASVNDATLTQTASGTGTVSNQGTASNESDGTAQIGDPDCEDEVTPPSKPGAPSLPRTGGELETQAALALMLLLAGGALTEVSRRRRLVS